MNYPVVSLSSLAIYALLMLGVSSATLATEATDISFQQAISQLQADGNVIVYTRNVADPNIRIPLPSSGELDMANFASALKVHGLTVEQNAAGTWFIVADTSEPTPSPALIRGRVTSSTTGEPLPGVAVEIAGSVTYTNSEGWFEVPAPEARPVQVHADGYQSKTLLSASAQEILEVPLDPETGIEEVVVVSSRYSLQRSMGPSVRSLDVDELTGIPELGDDALRAASHLPGMASIGISAKPHIRGGLQDELLVLFNNVELLEPFHLKDFQNVFASFNPSLIESVDVYTGGFPARFGDRMSGVIDIQPATRVDGFQAELMLSFLTASASAAGTSNKGRGRWALSARRGNLDLVLDRIDRSTGDPEYSDYFASYSYDLTEASALEFGFIAYDDNVVLKDLDDGDGEFAQSNYDNVYAWTQLHHDWSARNTSTTLFSLGTIDNHRNGFINDEDPEEGSSSLNDKRSFDVFTLFHQQHLDFSERLILEFGGRLGYQEGKYNTSALIERGALGEVIGLPIVEVRNVLERPSGVSGGLYSSLRIQPLDRLTLEFGGRWDYQDFADSFDQQFSPRASARLALFNNTALRLSAGRFYQPEQIHELQAADGISSFQAPQYADHFIIGVDQLLAGGSLSLRLEAFLKKVRDPKARHENLFNPWVLMPEIASDRIAIAPEKARTRGFEISMDYRPQDNFNSWASYSYAKSQDRINGEWQARAWDQRHTLSTGFIWSPGNWTLSAALLWHSGWRTTDLPDSLPTGEFPNLQRNSDDLPSYISLDARIARTWQGDNQSLSIFAEITNLLDRSNIGAYEYDFEETDGGYNISSEGFTLLPLIPSLGIRWSFH